MKEEKVATEAWFRRTYGEVYTTEEKAKMEASRKVQAKWFITPKKMKEKKRREKEREERGRIRKKKRKKKM